MKTPTTIHTVCKCGQVSISAGNCVSAKLTYSWCCGKQ